MRLWHDGKIARGETRRPTGLANRLSVTQPVEAGNKRAAEQKTPLPLHVFQKRRSSKSGGGGGEKKASLPEIKGFDSRGISVIFSRSDVFFCPPKAVFPMFPPRPQGQMVALKRDPEGRIRGDGQLNSE